MNPKKPRSPADILTDGLSRRPQGTRCVLLLDPDRVAEPGRTITDAQGRVWETVIYRGDDVITRRAWQRAWAAGQPVLLVLSRAEEDDAVLDASSLADLTGWAEGEPIDLSLLGYFHCLFPKVNPPRQVLAEYRRAFLEHVPGIVKAYPRFKEKWGEPDVWTRGQFLAILLLARFSQWGLDDLWCNEVDPAAFAAHAVGLLCHPSVTPDDLPALAEVIWESSRHARGSEACRWLNILAADLETFRAEVAGYLVIRHLLAMRSLPHLDALLTAKLPASTFDAEEVGPRASAVLAALKESPGRWAHVQARSREFLTVARLQKVAELLEGDAEVLGRVAAASDTAPVVLSFLLRQAILARCAGSPWPPWVEQLGQHPLLTAYQTGEALAPPERDCAALISAAHQFAGVERTLAEAVPSFDSPEALLEWYTAGRRHLLEYRTADAFAKLELLDDRDLHIAGDAFVMKSPDGLRYRVRRYLNDLDRRLAEFVRSDPQKFLTGKRSAARILPDVVRGGGRARNRRVWILVMDGMRYDTWEVVVRPLLVEHFEVVDGQDRAYFSLLPSKTDIARRGLLAGALGKDWRDYNNRPTKDERKLAARALGVPGDQLDSKVLFVAEAETTQARAKMRSGDKEAHDFNVLIYPISDDLGHHHNDTLAALNEKIRQQLLTQQGMRGIVDDLRWRVQPGDLVLVTSDHGFQELFPEECVPISLSQAQQRGRTEEDVAYRHLKFAPGKDWKIGDHVVLSWEELSADNKKQQATFTLPVGGAWYQREKGRPARFAHGGLSLAEMTIPAVLLQPIAQKAARVEFLDLSAEAAGVEDEPVRLKFEIVNSGNVASTYELTAETNLGEPILDRKATLGPGKREWVECTALACYEADRDHNPIPRGTLMAIFLQLAHTDLTGKVIRPNYGRQTVQVSVKPKPTKIDTSALAAFDDL